MKRNTTTLAIAVLVWAALDAWAGSFSMNPDGIAYLDIAAAYARGEWSHAINSSWPPLYSWLIAPAFLLDVSPEWQWPAVHVLQFLIFIGACLAYVRMVRELLAWRSVQAGTEPDSWTLSSGAIQVVGVAMFTIVSLTWCGLTSVTPDMLLCCFVFLCTGQLVRIARTGGNFWDTALFGVLLALGFLTKPVMLFYALLCLGSLFAVVAERRLLRVAVAAVAFVALAGPWVAAISVQEGRFTYSDSGALNYRLFVNPGSEARSEPHGSTPSSVWLFEGDLPGAYPPHTYRSLWENPSEVSFSFSKQLAAWIRGIRSYYSLLFRTSMLLFVVFMVILAVFSRATWSCARRSVQIAAFAAPSVAVLGIYATVLVLPRYAFPFILAASTIGLAAMRTTDRKQIEYGVRACVCGLLALCAIVWTANVCRVALTECDMSNDELIAARQFARAGVERGDKVCVVAHEPRGGSTHYWAQLAGVRIAAQIDAKRYWQATEQQRASIANELRRHGVVALVSKEAPEDGRCDGWKCLSSVPYDYLLLEGSQADGPWARTSQQGTRRK